MTADKPQRIPVDLQDVICPMCNCIVFRGVIPYSKDRTAEPSDALRAQGAELIAEHERTCPGNH